LFTIDSLLRSPPSSVTSSEKRRSHCEDPHQAITNATSTTYVGKKDQTSITPAKDPECEHTANNVVDSLEKTGIKRKQAGHPRKITKAQRVSKFPRKKFVDYDSQGMLEHLSNPVKENSEVDFEKLLSAHVQAEVPQKVILELQTTTC
jgi:hypothetical protein